MAAQKPGLLDGLWEGGLWRLRDPGMSGSGANAGVITCQPSGAAVGSEEGPEEATHSIVSRDAGGSIRYRGGTWGSGSRLDHDGGVAGGGPRVASGNDTFQVPYQPGCQGLSVLGICPVCHFKMFFWNTSATVLS